MNDREKLAELLGDVAIILVEKAEMLRMVKTDAEATVIAGVVLLLLRDADRCVVQRYHGASSAAMSEIEKAFVNDPHESPESV